MKEMTPEEEKCAANIIGDNVSIDPHEWATPHEDTAIRRARSRYIEYANKRIEEFKRAIECIEALPTEKVYEHVTWIKRVHDIHAEEKAKAKAKHTESRA